MSTLKCAFFVNISKCYLSWMDTRLKFLTGTSVPAFNSARINCLWEINGSARYWAIEVMFLVEYIVSFYEGLSIGGGTILDSLYLKFFSEISENKSN